MSREQPGTGSPQRHVPALLVVIALLVGVLVFWVVATPHEQCYISDGSLFGREYPLERVPGNRFRGVPSQFQDGDYISSDARIECRWELGQPYRVGLFGN